MIATSMVGREIFIDSAYLLALEIADDQYLALALEHWRRIAERRPSLVTTSYIFDEVVTFLNSHGLHAKAVQRGKSLLSSPATRFVHVDEALFTQGWELFQRYNDKDYSLTDCISFVVMRRFALSTAFTFDRHFIQAGFAVEP